ncbi:hypothetical protein GH733_014410 [Mirounga leonina]|nr:hypothetical protein GH733_014410 [Mirounga leonina]
MRKGHGWRDAIGEREDDSSQPPDACRIHGHLYVNKVAGNFHITVGKAIPHPRGHAHLAALVNHDSYNFSHRIDHLSFGELVPGIINPLDGTEKIAVDHNQMFQYFITVVPTKLHTYKISADTHQFSVTERERVINHAAGSHGVSGIFMKYDLSSLMVTVTEEHMPFWQFFVRLCGIVGGIFSTTGMLHGIGKFIVEIIYCRFRLGSYKPVSSISEVGVVEGSAKCEPTFPIPAAFNQVFMVPPEICWMAMPRNDWDVGQVPSEKGTCVDVFWVKAEISKGTVCIVDLINVSVDEDTMDDGATANCLWLEQRKWIVGKIQIWGHEQWA